MKNLKFCGIFLALLLLFSGCTKEKAPDSQQKAVTVPQEEYEECLYSIQWNSFPGLVGSPYRYYVESELEAPKKEFYENEALQKGAAELFAGHKLETKAQVTEYARLFVPILRESGCLPPQEMEAWKAIHYSNGIWLFIYHSVDEHEVAQGVKQHIRMDVYISDTDGHVIKLKNIE